MYIIIVGAGNLGYYVTQTLSLENHDIVVVEKDIEKSKKVSDELGVLSIHGDATELSTLQKAGIDQADIVICLTEVDETNLVIGLIAKELGVETVASSLSKVHYQGAVLKKLGIDIVIHPEAAAAGYISQLITQPDILDLSFFSRGDAEIIEYEVKDDSKFLNKTLDDFNKKLPKNSKVIGIYDKNNFSIPNNSFKVKKDIKILIIAKKEKVKSIRKL